MEFSYDFAGRVMDQRARHLIELLEALRHELTSTRHLALSVSDAAEDVIAVIRAGAGGYVTKTIEPEELVSAIERVHAGDALSCARSPRGADR